MGSYRKRWKCIESYGREWKVMEPYGSLWKTRECSIGKLGKRRKSGPEFSLKKEGGNYVNMGQSVTLHLLVLSYCWPSDDLYALFLPSCHRPSDKLRVLFLLPFWQSMKCADSLPLIPHRSTARIPRVEGPGDIKQEKCN